LTLYTGTFKDHLVTSH